MPRVEPGTYAVDVKTILELSGRELASLAEWAVSEGALFVTSPSIVTVRLEGAGSFRFSLGYGSLISASEPPVPALRLSSHEWVDACRAGEREPKFSVAPGAAERVTGRAVSKELRDPVAMMLNSLPLDAEVASSSANPVLVLLSQGREFALLGLTEDGYELAATGGRAHELLVYALTVYTSCGGGEA